MKKLITISLLFVFLCANTELHQLFNTPTLIHHYLEHKEKNPDCSVLTFLQEHYSNESEHNLVSEKEHENLPFKTNDCTTSHTVLAFDNLNKYSFRLINTSSVKLKIVYEEATYSSAILNKIWQPPQTV